MLHAWVSNNLQLHVSFSKGFVGLGNKNTKADSVCGVQAMIVLSTIRKGVFNKCTCCVTAG